jgi:hypothetical protein
MKLLIVQHICKRHEISLSFFFLSFFFYGSTIFESLGRFFSTFLNLVGFDVLTALSMKKTAFWDIDSYSLVELNRRFRDAYRLNHRDDRPDNGGSTYL